MAASTASSSAELPAAAAVASASASSPAISAADAPGLPHNDQWVQVHPQHGDWSFAFNKSTFEHVLLEPGEKLVFDAEGIGFLRCEGFDDTPLETMIRWREAVGPGESVQAHFVSLSGTITQTITDLHDFSGGLKEPF